MEIANGVLTICLLTRGRDAFLPECLASLEQFAKDPDVKFLVINNGAGEYSSKLLFEFVQRDVVNRNLIVREMFLQARFGSKRDA
jgi:2-hydroxy-3-keto-5-methylthiopentenyl-1-phosphate phosphatase